MLRCSGREARWRVRLASSSESQHDRAVACQSPGALPAVGRVGELPFDLLGHWPCQRFEVVSRIAQASTSCSACASMSAASNRGSPSAAMIRISVGPGDEVDAHFAGEQLLGGGHIDVAGADDAVRFGNGLRAEGEGRDRLCAAHLKNVLDSQQVRGPEILRHGARAGDADGLARPPLAREPPSSSAWTAMDSGPRECKRPSNRAAARSAPVASRARFRIHDTGICMAAKAPMLAEAVATASRNSGGGDFAAAGQLASAARERYAAPSRRTGAHTPSAPDRRASGRLPESDAPRLRPLPAEPSAG